MRVSQQVRLIGVLCIVVAVLLALLWVTASIIIGADLVMNGVWLIALLLAASGAALGYVSLRIEEREQRGDNDHSRVD